MTDDCASERKAPQTVYSDATLLLCTFHVLQAFWRFLWDSHTGVQKADRQLLFSYLKAMVYADSETQLDEAFSSAMADATVSLYAKVMFFHCSSASLCHAVLTRHY